MTFLGVIFSIGRSIIGCTFFVASIFVAHTPYQGMRWGTAVLLYIQYLYLYKCADSLLKEQSHRSIPSVSVRFELPLNAAFTWPYYICDRCLGDSSFRPPDHNLLGHRASVVFSLNAPLASVLTVLIQLYTISKTTQILFRHTYLEAFLLSLTSCLDLRPCYS